MAMNRRSVLVYGLLLVVWGLILGWQATEHVWIRDYARISLINRAKDISTTVGLVMRSQRHFGIISQDRMESALNALVRPDELTAVALLNASGEVVASAGTPIDFELKGLVPSGEHWGGSTVTLMNLVDLGTNVASELEDNRPTIVIPRGEMPPFGTNRTGTNAFARPRERPPEPQHDTNAPPMIGGNVAPNGSNSVAGDDPDRRGRQRGPARGRDGGREGREGRAPFGRPLWMSKEEYENAIQKKGVHSFVMVLSTQSMTAANAGDLWLRVTIGILATISVVGFGFAWRNMLKSSELQIRLVKASELNSHLKEMNLAAAGLAHETRNPLNIIRGLAHMISRQPDAPAETREKSTQIINEADRVASQLNEFINYSRPREVRRKSVRLDQVFTELTRTLGCDIEDKRVTVKITGDPLVIEADDQLLRQALFNLLMNAIQAVQSGGEIQIHTRRNADSAILEIRDNGPGVPVENRAEIFKPYFTTQEKGTGLGLAIVQQIVLAHGWEIGCLANEPHGAVFRITHLRIVS
jgi:signal transduction histidine kinase